MNVKLNPKIIIVQTGATILLASAFFLLKIVLVWDKYSCGLKFPHAKYLDCWSDNIPVGDFFVQIMWWRVYGLLAALVTIFWINSNRNVHFSNTIFVSGIALILFPTRFFQSKFAHLLFDPIEIFSLDVFNYLLYGVLLTAATVFLLFISTKLNLSTTHNTG